MEESFRLLTKIIRIETGFILSAVGLLLLFRIAAGERNSL